MAVIMRGIVHGADIGESGAANEDDTQQKCTGDGNKLGRKLADG